MSPKFWKIFSIIHHKLTININISKKNLASKVNILANSM